MGKLLSAPIMARIRALPHDLLVRLEVLMTSVNECNSNGLSFYMISFTSHEDQPSVWHTG